MFRADAAEQFPDDHDVLRLRDHVVTLAELLTQHLQTGSRQPLPGGCWRADADR